MTDIQPLLDKAQDGFKTLTVSEKFQNQALEQLKQWLTDQQYADYVLQIEHIITNHFWDYLLDSFYQVIPFGTGGRRGEVGVGPNRINPWTVKASCQGHSQFLIKHYDEEAKERGVVLAYDVREFFTNKYFNDDLPNPVKNLTCRKLAEEAAQVYAANGIKVFIFEDIRTTPQLSFAIRHLNAVGGNVFSASHNPPEHNGQKVFDEFGGQLIPPEDEKLVKEVTEHMSRIEDMDFAEGEEKGLIVTIGKEVDDAYLKATSQLSVSKNRDVRIVYSPLHGTGLQNIYASLINLGFTVEKDPKTSNPSGKFENVTFNIPNPEVEQSFDTPLKHAKEYKADIVMSSDPDSDRFGAMIHHEGKWQFLNGNEIGAILTEYIVSKKKGGLKGRGVVIKTGVTTNLITEICRQNNVDVIGDLLVGFKYVGEEMNKLEKEGRIDDFLIGTEESHGYLTGNYARDKDSAPAAILFAELAADLKKEGKTVIDYLNEIYTKYGYFRNYLTEIRLPGAEGRAKIDKIQENLRENQPALIGRFKVIEINDYLDHKPIVSETDASGKNMIAYRFEPVEGTISIKVTIRPSGTEPKSKIYFEIGSEPFGLEKFEKTKEDIEKILLELEKDVMQYCYRLIGVDFPDRGFLLFFQLPLDVKLRYFEIEQELSELKEVKDKDDRQKKVAEMLKFLGSDPIGKIDKAFKAKYDQGVEEYLDI